MRVYWEDTDAGGIVYYANYLKFFERARTEWLRACGVEQQGLRDRLGLMFVVTQAQVRYLQPARLDDELRVSVVLHQAGRASLVLAQQVWRGDDLLAEGEVRVGCVAPHASGALRPARLPEDLLQRIA